MHLNHDEVLALIHRYRAGETRALDQLLKAVSGSLRRICDSLARRTGDDGEDLYQDTLLHVIRYLDSYRGEAAFTTWVYTVARSRSIRRRRRVLAGTDVLGAPVDLRDDDVAPLCLESEMASRELGQRLASSLSALSEIDRQILVGRDGLGMTAAEVAAQVGLTVPAVKTRLHRARARVRADMVAAASTPAFGRSTVAAAPAIC